jgi:hypothetical protein
MFLLKIETLNDVLIMRIIRSTICNVCVCVCVFKMLSYYVKLPRHIQQPLGFKITLLVIYCLFLSKNRINCLSCIASNVSPTQHRGVMISAPTSLMFVIVWVGFILRVFCAGGGKWV